MEYTANTCPNNIRKVSNKIRKGNGSQTLAKCERPAALFRRCALNRSQCTTNNQATNNTKSIVPFDRLLRGVIAYVDIQNNNKDRSVSIKLLRSMGATVNNNFSSGITHVIFENGSVATYKKAKLVNAHLVSVAWVEAVRNNRSLVPEEQFTALGIELFEKGVTEQGCERQNLSTYYQMHPNSEDMLFPIIQHLITCTRKSFSMKYTNRNTQSKELLNDSLFIDKSGNLCCNARKSNFLNGSCVGRTTTRRRNNTKCNITDITTARIQKVRLIEALQKYKSQLNNGKCSENYDDSFTSNEENKENLLEGFSKSNNNYCNAIEVEESLSSQNIPSLRLSGESEISSESATSSKKSKHRLFEPNNDGKCSNSDDIAALCIIEDTASRTDFLTNYSYITNRKETKEVPDRETSNKIKCRKLYNIETQLAELPIALDRMENISNSELTSVKSSYRSVTSKKDGSFSFSPITLNINEQIHSKTYKSKNELQQKGQGSSDSKKLENVLVKKSMPNKKDGATGIKIKKLLHQNEKKKQRKGREKLQIETTEFRKIIPELNRRSTLEFITRTEPTKTPIISRKNTKKGLAYSRIHSREADIIKTIVRQLGMYSVEDGVTCNTSHLVMGETRRTVNVLKAIIRGCWIIKREWIYESLSAGKWLPEDHFEITKFSPVLKHCRKQRQVYGDIFYVNVFQDCGSIFIGNNTIPSRRDLEDLITMCHGKITKISRMARISVGQKIQSKAICVRETWVLDSVTNNRREDYDKYLLK